MKKPFFLFTAYFQEFSSFHPHNDIQNFSNFMKTLLYKFHENKIKGIKRETRRLHVYNFLHLPHLIGVMKSQSKCELKCLSPLGPTITFKHNIMKQFFVILFLAPLPFCWNVNDSLSVGRAHSLTYSCHSVPQSFIHSFTLCSFHCIA